MQKRPNNSGFLLGLFAEEEGKHPENTIDL